MRDRPVDHLIIDLGSVTATFPSGDVIDTSASIRTYEFFIEAIDVAGNMGEIPIGVGEW